MSHSMILGGPFVPLWGFITPCSDLGGVFTRRGWVCATLSISLTRSVSSSGALAIGYVGTNWELDFKQCSFHHIMQVWRVCNFCAFSLPPAFPPCSCPLTFRHQVRWVTSRISSESYPGNQECVATCHGAEEFTCVHHTDYPAPSPPDAGRYTVPSRFGCQSGDCGYVVRGHWTARYLAAVPRRILLMEQQVWSLLRARQSTLRPRVAVPSPHGTFQEHAAHIAKWPAMLSPNGSSDTCISNGVFHIPMPCFHGALPVYPNVIITFLHNTSR